MSRFSPFRIQPQVTGSRKSLEQLNAGLVAQALTAGEARDVRASRLASLPKAWQAWVRETGMDQGVAVVEEAERGGWRELQVCDCGRGCCWRPMLLEAESRRPSKV